MSAYNQTYKEVLRTVDKIYLKYGKDICEYEFRKRVYNLLSPVPLSPYQFRLMNHLAPQFIDYPINNYGSPEWRWRLIGCKPLMTIYDPY